MKRTFDEKIENAKKAYVRAKALAKVYDMVENAYKNNFMHWLTDPDTDDIMKDENGDWIYEENEVNGSYDYDYDKEYEQATKDIFLEILDKIANYK